MQSAQTAFSITTNASIERPEQQDIGLNDARTEETGFVGFPASIPVSDWADSSAFDDLLLGRDYDFLQDMAYAAEL